MKTFIEYVEEFEGNYQGYLMKVTDARPELDAVARGLRGEISNQTATSTTYRFSGLRDAWDFAKQAQRMGFNQIDASGI